MNKVRVLRLSGCRYCKELVGKLDNKGIDYESLDADEYSDFADGVEDFTGIRNYPIVIVTFGSSYLTFYLYKASSTEEIGESVIGEAIKVGHFTIDSLIENLIGLIN